MSEQEHTFITNVKEEINDFKTDMDKRYSRMITGQLILNALTKEPYKSVVVVIDKLQVQAKAQMDAEEEKKEKPI